MRLHRFFVEEKLEVGEDISIPSPELTRQLRTVFRFAPGDRVFLFNGTTECEAVIVSFGRAESVEFHLERKLEGLVHTREIHLFQAIVKKENFEMIVRQGTELGVTDFHPVLAARSEKKNLDLTRLKRIAKEATEQSGWLEVPRVHEPIHLKDVHIAEIGGTVLVFDPRGEQLKKPDGADLAIFIGPEGGFTEEELGAFKKARAHIVTLGPNILRAETASIASLALVL